MATILVVDDYSANREFLITLLGYSGHRLLEAADGAEALKVVRTEHPDLVIADLVMPTMDGYEFVHQLRADPSVAQTPVIFCTATYLQSEAWALAQSCGVRHIITKPAEPEIVLKIVAEALALDAPILPSRSSEEEFQREHRRVLTDKLLKQVKILEQEAAARKHLEAVLQQERDLLEVTLTSIGDGVIATDPAGTVTFLNPVAETLTGWRVQEARGRKVEEIFPLINEKTRQPVASLVERIQREGKGMELTDHTLLLARDGRAIPIADSGAPIRGKSGRVEGVVLVFRDITEKKQIEEALIRAKEAAEATDRSKSEFLATMSHELRTPLHVILGYTAILLDGGCNNIPAEELKALGKIDQNARVLCELINMVLDLNHLEAGRLHVEVKPVQLADLMGEIRVDMQGLCDQSGLTFVWNVEELPVLQTDPGKLKVVIKNLVGNAIKFTNEGSVAIDAHAHANGVEISVADTGIGIPSDAYCLIFEPFRQIDNSATRLYGGSGLGLHIVKRLLGLLKGTVTVASQVGQGSTFRVWLPVNPLPSEEEVLGDRLECAPECALECAAKARPARS